MNFFGLDIGSSSIKLIQVKKEDNDLSLQTAGEVDTPVSLSNANSDKEMKKLVKTVKDLKEDAGVTTNKVVGSLPESKVVSRLKWFPPMKENEIRSALRFEAETFIPYPLDKVQLDYQIVDQDDDGRVLVFVVAAPNDVINKYVDLSKRANLDLISLETPAVALARYFSVNELSTLIIDMAYNHSYFVACKSGQVYLTRTVPIGAKGFSRAISLSLGLDEEEAESYRRAYGFQEDQLEGKVSKSMQPVWEKYVGNVKKTILSFREDWGKDVEVIVLTGGGVMMPDFSEELTRTLGVEVQTAQPFSDVKIKTEPPFDIKKEGPRFAVAMGLATRGLIE
ncbi:MAG: type IV pilus assembly protein PilM [Pirellulaceae bacterium]